MEKFSEVLSDGPMNRDSIKVKGGGIKNNVDGGFILIDAHLGLPWGAAASGGGVCSVAGGSRSWRWGISWCDGHIRSSTSTVCNHNEVSDIYFSVTGLEWDVNHVIQLLTRPCNLNHF